MNYKFSALIELAKSAQAAPVQPRQSVQPVQPIQPRQPRQPIQPIQPTHPRQPVQPTQPIATQQNITQNGIKNRSDYYNNMRSKITARGGTFDQNGNLTYKGKIYQAKDVNTRLKNMYNNKLETARIRKFNEGAAARHAAVGKITPYTQEQGIQNATSIAFDPNTTAVQSGNAILGPKKINATINGRQVYKYRGKNQGYHVQADKGAYNAYGDNIKSLESHLGANQDKGLPVFMNGKVHYYKNGRLSSGSTSDVRIGNTTLDRYGNIVRNKTYRSRRVLG